MTTLNLMVSDQLRQFKIDVDAQIAGGLKKDDAIFSVLKDYIKASKKIRFEGDGYSDAWRDEAAKRGLNNTPDTPRALDYLVTKDAEELFNRHGVLSKVELHARYEILQEEYFKHLQIESRTLGDLVNNHIIPAAIKYQSVKSENLLRLKALLSEATFKKTCKEQMALIEELSERIELALRHVAAMTEARKQANKIESARERALAYCDNVKPYLTSIRYEVDKMELIVDNETWPLPKFRELLYIR